MSLTDQISINTHEVERILRCPIKFEPLKFCSKEEGSKHLPLESFKGRQGFINESNSAFYPLIDGIICLLPEYAFTNINVQSDEDMESVREFYDQFGWTKDNDAYHDQKIFVDQRNIASEYRSKSTKRVNQFLQKKGKYMLDIASGPVYQAEYKEFSKYFETRICVDLSITALREAQQNIKPEKGIFIVGDISNIPLRDEVCDNVVSMHTLYHVPKNKQGKAVHEMCRVCKSGSNVVIAYNWGWHSMLMNIALFPSRLLRLIQRVAKKSGKSKAKKDSLKQLYFYSHSQSFFKKITPPGVKLQFSIQKSLHENFIKLYLGNSSRSKRFLTWIFKMESKYPGFFGKHGAFPLLIFRKS